MALAFSSPDSRSGLPCDAVLLSAVFQGTDVLNEFLNDLIPGRKLEGMCENFL